MIDTDVINVTIDRSLHTLLVVDDNAATRYSTGRVLKAAGFRILEAANGTEAIERSAEGVSGVVLDVHLPDIDGFDVCRAIRARNSTEHLPVVHLSATHVADEDRVTGLNAGADAYLVHPAEPAVLVATMQALIRARTAEDQLRRSEQRYRAIHDHAQSGIAVLDAQGRFEDANPAMQRLLGRTREEMIGKSLAELAPADWSGLVANRAARLIEPGNAEGWHGEFPLLAADGRDVYLDWTISAPIEGGLRVAIANDASERHDLEQRRRDVLEREQAARSVAEQHSRTKDDFIAVLSHELRTPLNSIVGWVAILMRRNPTPDQVKGLQSIERNVKTQARIISDILDVSRINSGKLHLEPEVVIPSEVIGNAIASLRASIDEKAIAVQADIQQADQPAWLDPGRFQQIFWNLMTNAIKFSKKGGEVRVTLRRDADRLTLTVQDFGQGIKADFLPLLFDRFTQSDSPGNRTQGGLGLGLSIVKHLVDLHAGTVEARSGGTGQGTTMLVEIPVTIPAITAPAEFRASASSDDDETDGLGRPLQDLDILIVEDDPGASEMLSVVLSDRGARIRTANDFDSAIAEVGTHWPDVLISDIGLPGRDGYELIRRIRELKPPPGAPARLAAVALTAFARPEDKARALEAGFDAHTAKPLKPHALVTTVLGISPPRPHARG
ncbi:hybrid sensor histidine kinase/response regulator [Caenimonas aquaedulcis]|uniref:histidine kinase n=1 Tax=Caenimonas aquaedulcis TaxID=2793270 RepID=A0A931MFJ2_9BURK|nr:response regulator [Caenimonas aquaedulcis]MBG9387064.1 response regulator [Caenimonas aquaedulcis]